MRTILATRLNENYSEQPGTREHKLNRTEQHDYPMKTRMTNTPTAHRLHCKEFDGQMEEPRFFVDVLNVGSGSRCLVGQVDDRVLGTGRRGPRSQVKQN